MDVGQTAPGGARISFTIPIYNAQDVAVLDTALTPPIATPPA